MSLVAIFELVNTVLKPSSSNSSKSTSSNGMYSLSTVVWLIPASPNEAQRALQRRAYVSIASLTVGIVATEHLFANSSFASNLAGKPACQKPIALCIYYKKNIKISNYIFIFKNEISIILNDSKLIHIIYVYIRNRIYIYK